MDYTDVKNTYVIWDFFVTIKKCPHVHFVYSCFSHYSIKHEKQGRFFSIPKIGYVQLSIQETSADDTPVVTQAHTTDCTVDGDSVRKSGFISGATHHHCLWNQTLLSPGPGKFQLVLQTFTVFL